MKNWFALAAAGVLTLTMTTAAIAEAGITVGGKTIDGAVVKVDESGKTMIPVRDAAEALGLKVEWDGENKRVVLSDMPVYVTFTLGKDGYTFAKTAPMPLGQAPLLVDGKTYVPTELFSDVLGYDVKVDGAEVEISEKADGIVVSDVADGEITVNDPELGEVVLVPAADAKITDAQGNSISLEDIKEGAVLEVEYGAVMTMSLPPMNNPTAIKVVG